VKLKKLGCDTRTILKSVMDGLCKEHANYQIIVELYYWKWSSEIQIYNVHIQRLSIDVTDL